MVELDVEEGDDADVRLGRNKFTGCIEEFAGAGLWLKKGASCVS